MLSLMLSSGAVALNARLSPTMKHYKNGLAVCLITTRLGAFWLVGVRKSCHPSPRPPCPTLSICSSRCSYSIAPWRSKFSKNTGLRFYYDPSPSGDDQTQWEIPVRDSCLFQPPLRPLTTCPFLLQTPAQVLKARLGTQDYNKLVEGLHDGDIDLCNDAVEERVPYSGIFEAFETKAQCLRDRKQYEYSISPEEQKVLVDSALRKLGLM